MKKFQASLSSVSSPKLGDNGNSIMEFKHEMIYLMGGDFAPLNSNVYKSNQAYQKSFLGEYEEIVSCNTVIHRYYRILGRETCTYSPLLYILILSTPTNLQDSAPVTPFNKSPLTYIYVCNKKVWYTLFKKNLHYIQYIHINSAY
jgi:hypothetical protein